MTDAKLEALAEMFGLLSSKSKLKLLLALDEGEKSVKEIVQLVEKNGISQSSVSQHLKYLRWRGIVKSERKGNIVPYSLTKKGRKSQASTRLWNFLRQGKSSKNR